MSSSSFGEFDGLGFGYKTIEVPSPILAQFLENPLSLCELKLALRVLWFVSESKNGNVTLGELCQDKTVKTIFTLHSPSLSDLSKGVKETMSLLIKRGVFTKSVVNNTDVYQIDLRTKTKNIRLEDTQVLAESFEGGNKSLPVEVLSRYEKHIGPITPAVGEKLEKLSEEFGEQILLEAVELADMKRLRTVYHITSLCKNLAKNKKGVKTG